MEYVKKTRRCLSNAQVGKALDLPKIQPSGQSPEPFKSHRETHVFFAEVMLVIFFVRAETLDENEVGWGKQRLKMRMRDGGIPGRGADNGETSSIVYNRGLGVT
ncbi:Uncharacterized protein Fot_13618 [Forsythia ovata]|uniref:Uncharacterized protein n=1 Tax=Forsythia ovata TaxID=205694 RepID=A0ABD1W7H4_9LAMI